MFVFQRCKFMEIKMNYATPTYCEISDWNEGREDAERNNIDIRITSHAGDAVEKADLIMSLLNMDFRSLPEDILLAVKKQANNEWQYRLAAKHLPKSINPVI